MQRDIERLVLREQLPAAMKGLQQRYGTGRSPSSDLKWAVPSGIDALDDRLAGGFRRGYISCLGAQSGHGKTTIAYQFALCAARLYPTHTSVLISPEMGSDDIAEMAVLAAMQRRRNWLIQHPSEIERLGLLERVMEAVPPNLILLQIPKFLEDDKLGAIVGELGLLHAERPLVFVAVDYAQYLIGEIDTGRKQRFALAGDIVREFNLLADRTRCAVLMTSQVNITKEKGMTMRESALFEHAAATVLYFIRKFDDDGREQPDDTHFRIAKNRYGTLGKVGVQSEPGCYFVKEKIERF